ncbi:3-deoxy-7-phosphoheptulonate synthase [Spirochaeta africana]|uniref:Phospho-2-dehydro-3-deoxyheptonate aldolase n=1 Tax=Spirochaeta africana (strain ATCC 700263 / DSM 8902 / Z-7692) TaxID=889378 RepID=H9UKQ7_SPIAZ|nr:3-deoxy-7-phosphoheptulonate synthase [Spirochaeta africana]AFG38100.1 phospho-2-dehydro-3-deoxyheptonate aldolase [Spirochaeta africana DSM 8902]
MRFNTDDTRIQQLKPLIPPAILMEDYPLSEAGSETVQNGRAAIESIVQGQDDRLLVVIGPCSIHDTAAALEYAARLAEARTQFADTLEIVMRVYFEKPRSRTGWKGLINDPLLDGSFQINRGLRVARELLVEISDMGLPIGCEFLDTISPQFIADTVSWGAIGARTTESQIHRELASGLSMPVGFKNGTDGNIDIAIDAIHAASIPHHFLSVTKQSVAAIVETKGNPGCHIILRGGKGGPNYHEESVEAAAAKLHLAKLPAGMMIDCSHGNSSKKPERQPIVARDIADQLTRGSRHIFGVMIESHLQGGSQKLTDPSQLQYGVSITDACLSFADSLPVLETLSEAVTSRRKVRGQ